MRRREFRCAVGNLDAPSEKTPPRPSPAAQERAPPPSQDKRPSGRPHPSGFRMGGRRPAVSEVPGNAGHELAAGEVEVSEVFEVAFKLVLGPGPAALSEERQARSDRRLDRK